MVIVGTSYITRLVWPSVLWRSYRISWKSDNWLKSWDGGGGGHRQDRHTEPHKRQTVTRHDDFVSIRFYVRKEGRPMILYVLVVLHVEVDVLHSTAFVYRSVVVLIRDFTTGSCCCVSSKEIIPPHLSEILPWRSVESGSCNTPPRPPPSPNLWLTKALKCICAAYVLSGPHLLYGDAFDVCKLRS
jgi:hypothetical protein